MSRPSDRASTTNAAVNVLAGALTVYVPPGKERDVAMSALDVLRELDRAATLDAGASDAESEQRAADMDRLLTGTGYMLDGKRVDPARITILPARTPPDAAPDAVAGLDTNALDHAVEVLREYSEFPLADAVAKVAAALRAGPVAGFVLVPREPTPEMLAAGLDGFCNSPAIYVDAEEPDMIAAAYAAMLAAAPSAGAQEGR